MCVCVCDSGLFGCFEKLHSFDIGTTSLDLYAHNVMTVNLGEKLKDCEPAMATLRFWPPLGV